MTRPLPDEYTPFAARYVDLVPEDDLLGAMRAQQAVTRAAVLAYAGRPDFRYAPGKWSIRQVMGHMADAEQVFGFRALWVARSDVSPLPGYDQDAWMAASDFSTQPLETLLNGFEAARRSNLLMLGGLDAATWTRRGLVDDHAFSVRSLARMLLGHERAHLDVLRERYV
ncbi:DinB family protein [Deinococcus sp.]|uniref:DinB family protein n=1 Tax=Deinococcus sp. TaxID=47478 RepID=UPI0025E569EC|nr:DinB family protein [Deinococcus sp.]